MEVPEHDGEANDIEKQGPPIEQKVRDCGGLYGLQEDCDQS